MTHHALGRPLDLVGGRTKVLVIGDSGAGKSSLLMRFIDGTFSDTVAPTIGVGYKEKAVTVSLPLMREEAGRGENVKGLQQRDEVVLSRSSHCIADATTTTTTPTTTPTTSTTTTTTVNLQIWDTAGSERFRSLTPSYYRAAQGALVVFDLTRRETYEHIHNWLHEVRICSFEDEHGRILPKIIVGNKSDLADEAQVSEDEVASLASSLGYEYRLVSAKTSPEDVTGVFERLTQLVVFAQESNKRRRTLTTTRAPEARARSEAAPHKNAPPRGVSLVAASSTKTAARPSRQQQLNQQRRRNLDDHLGCC